MPSIRRADEDGVIHILDIKLKVAIKVVLSFLLLAISILSYSAGYIEADIVDVGVNWGETCATLKTADQKLYTIRMDHRTDSGKAEYSTILAAFAMKQKVQVYLTDTPESGICNVVTVTGHGMINLTK